MKTRLLPILLACGTLLPALPVQAAGTFGDFTPGQTFTLTVTDKITARTKGFRVSKDVPVPEGIPDFKVGDAVTFTVGLKGQLTGPGFKIAFRQGEDRFNTYADVPTNRSPEGDAATVDKNRRDKPVRALITFYEFKFSGFIPIATTVNYEFEK